MVFEGLLQRAFTDDAAAELEPSIAQDGAGGDEIIIAFLLDQTAHAENAAGGTGTI